MRCPKSRRAKCPSLKALRRTMGDRETTNQPPEAPIERALSAVRQVLEVDVAFVSEFVEDRLIFRAVEGTGSRSGGARATISRSRRTTAIGCWTAASRAWSPILGTRMPPGSCG